MIKHSSVPIACLLAATVAGCDSQSQLTVARGGPLPVTVAATESISSFNGSTPQIAYQFAAVSLPASVAAGNDLAVVLGGVPVPLVARGPLWVADLPPTARPPVPDKNSNVALLIQSDAGSTVVIAHVTSTLPQIYGPNATLSAAAGGI